MELNENAQIDTSQVRRRRPVRRRRRAGAGLPIPIGGGRRLDRRSSSWPCVVVGGAGRRQHAARRRRRRRQGDNTSLEQTCAGRPRPAQRRRLPQRALRQLDPGYWQTALPQRFGEQYQASDTVFFEQARQHRLRPGRHRRRPVLLPGGRPDLHRPDLLGRARRPVRRRAASSRSRTCWPTSTATTCRTCSAPRRRCAAPAAARPGQRQRATRCGWNCRPTATPARGPSTPPDHGRRRSADLHAHHRAGHPAGPGGGRRAIGDDAIQKKMPAAGGRVDSSPTARRPQRQQWFTRGLRHRRPEVLRHLQRPPERPATHRAPCMRTALQAALPYPRRSRTRTCTARAAATAARARLAGARARRASARTAGRPAAPAGGRPAPRRPCAGRPPVTTAASVADRRQQQAHDEVGRGAGGRLRLVVPPPGEPLLRPAAGRRAPLHVGGVHLGDHQPVAVGDARPRPRPCGRAPARAAAGAVAAATKPGRSTAPEHPAGCAARPSRRPGRRAAARTPGRSPSAGRAGR